MLFKTALITLTCVCIAQGAPKGEQTRLQDTEHHIIGGEIVKGREFPSQVFCINDRDVLRGSGSILNPEWILTTYSAAFSGKTVTAGTNYLNQGGTVHTIVEKYVHDDSVFGNDIVLLKVSPPITLGNGVDVVKLPKKGQEVPAGSKAIIASWGRTASGDPPSNELRKIEMVIKDLKKCQTDYEEVSATIFDTELCGQSLEKGKGLSYQDAGAPLFVNGELVGLNVWTTSYADPEYPDVFINVALFIDWIEEHIKPLQ